MAETGKKATADAVPPVNDPAPSTGANPTPETPAESKNASFLVSSIWPNTEFIVEGVPVITAEGTKLTKSQLKTAEEAAGPSGVSLHVEEVN